jgi:hypothetical protein
LVGVLLEKDKKWAFIEQKKGLVQKLTIQDTIGNPSQRIAVISLQFLQLAQEGKVYKTIAVGEKFA